MITPIKQGALPHGPVLLGDSDRTIRQSGCLLCCLVMVREALLNETMNVLEAHEIIKENNGFDGALLFVPKAAKTLGMRQEWRKPFDDERVFEQLRQENPIICQLVYQKNGKSRQHWVVAVDVVDDEVIRVADPATGAIRTLDISNPYHAGVKARLAATILLEKDQ